MYFKYETKVKRINLLDRSVKKRLDEVKSYKKILYKNLLKQTIKVQENVQHAPIQLSLTRGSEIQGRNGWEKGVYK